jgi:membrane-associated protein
MTKRRIGLDFLQHYLPWLPSLQEIVRWGGVIGIAAIVFAETGLLLGFFLPGDSLLVTAGVFAARGDLSVVALLIVLPIAAIAGNATGYLIGKKAGAALYSRPNSRFFKRSHLLRAHAFYEKYGGKTIILARFIPIIRTFAPTVAGAASMGYKRFLKYDIFGGTFWPISMVLVGYGSSRLAAQYGLDLNKHIHIVIAVVIALSLMPPLIEWIRARRGHSVAATPKSE